MFANMTIFRHLMVRDVTVLKKEFLGDLVNVFTWPLSLAVTFGYVLPQFGMDVTYGSFLLIGALASTFFYLAVGFGSELVNDFVSLRSIDFFVILPATSYHFFLVQRVFSFAVHAMTLSLPLIPIGKLLLGDKLNLVNLCVAKLLLITFMSGIFFGFFALWLASWVPNNRAFSQVWRRIYTPMQLLGCYWFSYTMAGKVFGWWGLLTLVNPLTFMCEGTRAAVFGPTDYMNFWVSVAALLIYTILFGGYAMYKLKRRLDLL